MGLRGRLVCPDCGKVMTVVKNGVVVRMGGYSGYFKADLFQCPKCGKQILAGFGSEFFEYSGKVDYNFKEGRKMRGLNEVMVFMTFRKIGGRCPFCGKQLMKGQNGFYCSCAKWNSVQEEAYREGLID